MPLFLVAVLGVSQCAGVFALKCTPFTCNNAIALACIGILVFTAMRSIGGALEKLLAKVCHENNSFAEKVHEIKKAIFDIVKVTWNIGITGFAFMWVIPVLIGMAIELYYNVLYAHYFSVGYLNHAADTSALSIAWGLWKGSILLSIGAVVVLEVADMIVPSIIDNMDHPRRWRVRRIMRRWALPLIARLGTVCMLPTVLAALSMAQRGTLSAGACWDLLLLKDTVALAPHIRMTLLAIIVVIVGTKAVLLYKACAEIVRNRLYANELVLENIDGSSSPHFGTPSPATPAAE
ncbi:hypothetical protein IW148_003791 [Coemansia sp. RSA 1199]|nr:hypothetical protein IW148_003791 [Coemansia sp. RSA 1199]